MINQHASINSQTWLVYIVQKHSMPTCVVMFPAILSPIRPAPHLCGAFVRSARRNKADLTLVIAGYVTPRSFVPYNPSYGIIMAP